MKNQIPTVLSVVKNKIGTMLNLFQHLSLANQKKEKSFLTKTGKRETPSQARGGQPVIMAKAFTLMELLVVVLIIGILAAIAVPQYQVVVQKAALANYRSLANSVAQGAISYHLASGAWPQKITDLDVSFPSLGQSSQADSCVYNTKMFCCLLHPVPSGANGTVVCGKADNSFAYISRFANDVGTPQTQHACFSKSDVQVCKASGGILNNTNARMSTYNGVASSMYEYVYRGTE